MRVRLLGRNLGVLAEGGGGLLVVVLTGVGVSEKVVGAGRLRVQLDRFLEFRLGLREIAVAEGGGAERVVGAEIAGSDFHETRLELSRLGVVAGDARRKTLDLDAFRLRKALDVPLRELDFLLRLRRRREGSEQGVGGREIGIELDGLLQRRHRLGDANVVDVGQGALDLLAGCG